MAAASKTGSAVQMNHKVLAQNIVDSAMQAGKKNAGSLQSLKVKMKFDNGKGDKPAPKKSQGMRSFINSQRATV